MRILDDVIHAGGARESGRDGSGVRLVHEARQHEHPRALQPLRGSRRQPRLLHGGAPRVHAHQPDHVPRVDSADHVQPSSDRAAGHGDVRAAVPRSVQLQLPSRRGRRHRRRRRAHGDAVHRRGQARRDAAARRPVFDLVQRRHPHHRALPQHHRDPHGDDRQPGADQHPVHRRIASSATRTSGGRSSRRPDGGCGSRSSTR